MVKTHIVITTDYELFVYLQGFSPPTYSMIELLDKYGAKLTVFAEMIECWRIKKTIIRQNERREKCLQNLLEG